MKVKLWAAALFIIIFLVYGCNKVESKSFSLDFIEVNKITVNDLQPDRIVKIIVEKRSKHYIFKNNEYRIRGCFT
ncbi:hypothetical protein [Desulfitibacter alkalitolerans]|uniref:hypothetical protein n=1 Tax=Desulfitibacter alkalitolerans TaxID=264641 RepID=UPI0004849F2A|nr:hypothetical protein [Desulfitibacter alkalitolerans]